MAMSDEEMLLARVPGDGSSVGNISLRRRLRWGIKRYFSVRDLLVQRGLLQLGGGRGGSVCRTETIAAPHPKPQYRRGVYALIIGNQAYKSDRPLANPCKDASDFAKLMASLGHETDLRLDLTLRRMDDAIKETARNISPDRGLLFYYAGHGSEFDDDNWLIPVDCRSSNDDDLTRQSLSLRKTLRAFNKARFRITILDACRVNPFRGLARGDEGGLREFHPSQDTPEGDFICYATGPRQVAADGKAGRNGVFTGALLKHLKEASGLSISDVMTRVRNEVRASTKNRQTPWEHSSLTASWYPNPRRV